MNFFSFYRKLTVFLFLFFCVRANAFEVPKDFQKQNEYDSKLWIQPKTLETIGISSEDVSGVEAGKDDFAEISELVESKGKTLSAVLNIKDYRVTSSEELKTKTGKVFLFFGSYVDSSGKLTNFTEIYEFGNSEKPVAYLLTRYNSPWTKKELAERFKVWP